MSFSTKKLRKWVAGVGVFSILGSLLVAVPANAAYYTDAYETLKAAGVVSEEKGGSNVSRCAVAKVLVLAAETELESDYEATFPDVPASDACADYIYTGVANGFWQGYPDGTFQPNRSINRYEFAVMANNVMALEDSSDSTGLDDDAGFPSWAAQAVKNVVAAGFFSGKSSGKFDGAALSLRGEMFVVANNVFSGVEEAGEEEAGEEEAGEEEAGEEVADADATETSEGALTVSLASTTPTTGTVPSSATAVPFTAFSFAAAGGDVTVKEFKVKREGVSPATNYSGVYLFDDTGARLTSRKSVSSDTNLVTFSNLNLVISAGTTKTYWIKADIAALTATGEGRFSVMSASDVTVAENDTVAGSFPVQGALMTLSTTTAGTVTIAKNGTLSNPQVGQKGAEIGKFQISASGEAAAVSRLSLTVKGTLNSTGATNFVLKDNSGEEVAKADAIGSESLVTFNLSPAYDIKDGSSKTFSLFADLSGQTNDTVLVYLKEDTDLVAIGGDYKFGMGVTRAAFDGGTVVGTEEAGVCAAATSDCSYTALTGGKLTLSFNGPVARTVPIDSDEIEFMHFSLTAESTMTVTQLAVIAQATDSGVIGVGDSTADTDGLINNAAATAEANLKDIKIVRKDTGATIWGPSELGTVTAAGDAAAADGAQTITFGDDYVIKGGETVDFVLRADIDNNAATAETYRFNVDVSELTAEDSNGDALAAADKVPSADVVGNSMTTDQANLTVSLSATPTSQNFVKGTKDVELVAAIFRAGSAQDLRATQLTFRFYGDADGTFENGEGGLAATDLMSSATLYVDGTKVKGPESMQLVGTIGANGGYYKAVFSSLNVAIPAGASKKVAVYVNLSNSITATRYLSGDLSPANDIVVEDDDGDSLAAAQITGADLNNTTAPSPRMTITTSGSLTVAVDAATPKEDIAVAGATDVAVSKLRFTTTDEPFVIEKLALGNRGSAVTSRGDQDDNVTQITLTYKDKDGNDVSSAGFLNAGNVQYSGLSIYVGKDTDATVTVSVNLNTITGGADAGDFVEVSLAANNFEAVGQGSGERFKGDKLDAAVGATVDLDFGTFTYTDGANAHLLDGAQDVTVSLAGSVTLTVDANGADPDDLPLGTVICIDDTDGGTCATEDIYVLTGLTDASGDGLQDTYTVLMIDNAGDDNYDDNDSLLYSAPAVGFLSGTNSFYVYESKPTVTLVKQTSVAKTVTSNDEVLKFTVAAAAQEKLQWRTGSELATCAVGLDANGANNGINATYTTTSVDGSACLLTLANWESNDTASFDSAAAGNISPYARVSLWLSALDIGNNSTDANIADFQVITSTTTTVADQNTALSAAACNAGSATALASGQWYFCDLAVPTGTDSGDRYVNVRITSLAGGRLATDDTVILDRVILYNEKMEFDLASDASMAAVSTTQATPELTTLKEGGNTVATGYVDKASTSAARVVLIPLAANGNFEVAKGTTKTLSLEVNTNTLMTDQAGTDDLLTPSFDYGSSGTAGDWRWFESNATATWFGNTGSTKFSGETLKY